jgi:Lon protease-like protein
MIDARDPGTRLPLFPLPDVVHFPRTELRIQVTEPRHLRLVQDVLGKEEDERRIGVVLLKPGWTRCYDGRPDIYAGGTAGRLLDAEPHPDGSIRIVLLGDFRFELEREVPSAPYREALVLPVEEPWLNERDAGIVAVRRAILDLLRQLAKEIGERFPVSLEEVDELAGDLAFEELVNRLASGLDLPPLRKLRLLRESLPERALSIASVLRSRRQVVDLLRPYRHLAAGSDRN